MGSMIPTAVRHLPAVFSRRRPVHLTLFVTRRCNAGCGFCFYRHDGQRPHTGQKDELSLDELEKISKNFGTLLWLALSGGEIFLRQDLVELVSIFYRNNRPAFLLLPTNGLLPERIAAAVEQIAAHCSRTVVTIKLSLDGPDTVHDTLRRVPGAAARVRETTRLLQRLQHRHRNLEIGYNSVYCDQTEATMQETIQMVQQGTPGMPHTITLVRGEAGHGSWGRVKADRYMAACRTLEEAQQKNNSHFRFAGARLKSAQDRLQRRIIYKVLSREGYQIPCLAGKLSLVVTEEGGLYPCENFSMRLGNFREHGYSLKSILEQKESRRVIADITRTRCHCTHECYLMLAILFNPRQYSSLFFAYFSTARQPSHDG